MKLERMTWPEVEALDRDAILVVAPIAACEQHSRHLPVFTDSILCGAVADGVDAALPDQILLLPVQWLGASDHHQPFGATITATVDHHVDLVADILESILVDGFRRVLVLNGHGGNIDTMRMALRRLQPKYPDRLVGAASYWELAAEELSQLAAGPRKTMGHACEFETSMMLHIRPELVRRDQIADDGVEPNEVLRGLTLARDFSQITSKGAVGFPTHATAERGKLFLEESTTRAIEVCRALLLEAKPVGRERRTR